MTLLVPAPGGQPAAGDDAGRWQEAARLCRDHPGWIVLWLEPKGQYRAYRRLPGARHDTILSAGEPGSLASQMEQAGQAARLAARRPKDRT